MLSMDENEKPESHVTMQWVGLLAATAALVAFLGGAWLGKSTSTWETRSHGVFTQTITTEDKSTQTPVPYSDFDFHELTVDAIRKRLTSVGVPTCGSKLELVARLEAAFDRLSRR